MTGRAVTGRGDALAKFAAALAWTFFAMWIGGRATAADTPVVLDGETFVGKVQPLLTQYCADCHGAETQEGELRLDNLPADFIDRRSADRWGEVLDRINLGEMPPQDSSQPTARELAVIVDWLTREIAAARRRTQSTGGRVMLRRLSRQEYANTVRDLLQVEFVEGEGPRDVLPPDGQIRGFDKNAKALLIDPSLMQAYFEAAQLVADQAVQFRPPKIPERTVRFEFRDTDDSAMSYILGRRTAWLEGDSMVLLESDARTFAKLYHPYNNREVPVTGRYRVRIQAAAVRGRDDQPVFMDVKQGPADRIARFQIDASPENPKVYEFETIRDEKFNGEYSLRMVNAANLGRFIQRRGRQLRKADELFQQGEAKASTRLKARLLAQGDFSAGAYKRSAVRLEGTPRLYLDWIEVTGPLQGSYPPRSMQRLFPDGWHASQQTMQTLEEIFRRLMPRAFRRPVRDSEVQALLRVVQEQQQRSGSFEQALKSGITAMLCAPDFVYLFEPSAPADQPRRLTSFELASRLSYFLWSSTPDDALFRSAANGDLLNPDELTSQVDRMLQDPRVEGLVQGFARQWLKVDEFDRFLPDEQIFPEFYEPSMLGVERDLVEQPLAMFREMLRSKEPLDAWLTADWTMVNQRLAAYYDLEAVEGAEFRRVSLPVGHARTRRGGILGMAGVHMWGADGSRTKPVERGKYILDVLFNDPPPPPPPNAGEVEPNVRGENLTVRERLQRHREQTTCNNCHRRIDPYGLALENFNVIGKWRVRQDGEKRPDRWRERKPIDPSGVFPNGKTFQDYAQFRQLMIEQAPRMRRGISEKLLSYALGRSLVGADRGAVDDIVEAAGAEEATWRGLIRAIVLSEPFQTK